MPVDQIRISIIVPVYDNPRDLRECLSGLTTSPCSGSEIIVVDDGSTDDTPYVAAAMGARVLRLAKNSGPAAARNYGARHARGEILLFIDADVVLAAGAFNRIEKVFREQPDLAAVFGSYDAQPKALGMVSQYRNLLHHFVHQNGDPDATTFWAGCGAIRRSLFEAVGGFDEKRFPRPSIEDIELGYRLRKAGYRILLDKSIQGKHLKRWNFWSLVRTDIARRAVPWSRLILETKNLPNDLNLKLGQRTSFLLVLVACAFFGFALLRPGLVGVSLAALLGLAVLNRKLYAFFFRQHGMLFATTCVALHFLYYLYSGASYLCVWIVFHLKRTTIVRTTAA
jgi:glycosyltransferase involved in cell wall biosynthesis